jgi:hypothetical protein
LLDSIYICVRERRESNPSAAAVDKTGKNLDPTRTQSAFNSCAQRAVQTLTNELYCTTHAVLCAIRTSGALFGQQFAHARAALPLACCATSRWGRICINNENENNWGCESLFCSVRKESRRAEHSQLFAASIWQQACGEFLFALCFCFRTF